ncbi:uncharacterized protein [Nicotiana sylvestris]|uniref:uncharacterized protein n=1 Tax=Nicotiana sylvestris TaxID=4096 RepID=UPI00388CC372
MGIQEVLVLGDSDLLVHQIEGEWETRDLKLILYRYCVHDLCQQFRLIEFRHIPRIYNEIADALATLVSMLHHPYKAYVDPLHIQIRDQHAYYYMIKEEIDGEPWFYDIREYIKMGCIQYKPHVIKREQFVIWQVDFSSVEEFCAKGLQIMDCLDA